jgi:hypothetical protein
MTLRSALSQSWYITVPVLAFLGWLLLKTIAVYDLLATAGTEGAYIGTAWVPGVVGLVVMGAVALMLLVLYSELGEATPGPSPWPPDE